MLLEILRFDDRGTSPKLSFDAVLIRKLGKGFPSADFGLSLSGGRSKSLSPPNSGGVLVRLELVNPRRDESVSSLSSDVLITAGVTGGSCTSGSWSMSGRKVTTSSPTRIEGLPLNLFPLAVFLDS